MFYAFLLTTLAGLATLLGTIPIFVKIKNKDLIIGAACAFAGGVMICISILDLIPESLNYLSNYFSNFLTITFSFIFIIIGIIISKLIDKYIDYTTKKSSLYKVGIISMIAIILHNIPEDCIHYVSRQI